MLVSTLELLVYCQIKTYQRIPIRCQEFDNRQIKSSQNQRLPMVTELENSVQESISRKNCRYGFKMRGIHLHLPQKSEQVKLIEYKQRSFILKKENLIFLPTYKVNKDVCSKLNVTLNIKNITLHNKRIN